MLFSVCHLVYLSFRFYVLIIQSLTYYYLCIFFGRFLQAFQLLQNAPKAEHCWCSYKEIMYPLLEPFSWYFEEPNPQSALHSLWRRLCSELSACTRCVKIHHEAKEEYKKEYDEVHVEPLLAVLQVKLFRSSLPLSAVVASRILLFRLWDISRLLAASFCLLSVFSGAACPRVIVELRHS